MVVAALAVPSFVFLGYLAVGKSLDPHVVEDGRGFGFGLAGDGVCDGPRGEGRDLELVLAGRVGRRCLPPRECREEHFGLCRWGVRGPWIGLYVLAVDRSCSRGPTC